MKNINRQINSFGNLDNKSKSIYNESEYIEWGGLINEFFWICAGVNKSVLRQCPTDYAKYAGIGGTILFTSLMAMLSGGYALFFVFKEVYISIAFGIFWGLLIFNLDRFIVNTMYSDGKVTISWKEFSSGLPRIVMAIFLGVVISTPLELKIFESEINIRIEDDKEKKISQYKAEDELRRDSIINKIEELKDKPYNIPIGIALTNEEQVIKDNIAENKNKIKDVDDEIERLKVVRSKLSDSDSLRYKQIGNQLWIKVKEIRTLNQNIKQLEGQLASVSAQFKDAIVKEQEERSALIKSLNIQIDEINNRLKDAEGYADKIKNEYGGLQARLKAFEELQDENISTRVAAWCIMLLFIIIETAPTFFKMMIASGPYDDLLRAEMHRVRVLSDKSMSDINDEINTEIMISVQKNKERLEAEVLANKQLMEIIAKTQAELLQTAIEKWREEELEKIAKDPSGYIKTSDGHNCS